MNLPTNQTATVHPKSASGLKPADVPRPKTPAPAPKTAAPQNAAPKTTVELAGKYLQQFDKTWQKAQLETARRIRALNPDARSMIELQSTIQQLGLGAQLLAQTAEALGGTIRRVQQLGGS